MKEDFTGFPKENFRQQIIDHWMKEGIFHTEQEAIDNYGGHDFDNLCERCDGTTLLSFRYEINNHDECFEVVDNNFVIPVSAIHIYKNAS